MKKILKKLKKVNKEIEAKKSELRNTEELAYYYKIATEREKERDIKEINIELKSLYSLKYSILETLQQQINLEKARVSALESPLILLINK